MARFNEVEHKIKGDEFKKRLRYLQALPEYSEEQKDEKMKLLLELKNDMDFYLVSVGLMTDHDNFIAP